MAGWGTGAWGTGPWGGATPQPPLAIENAVATSTKEVTVTLNRDPQEIAPTVPGDALNPATWIIQRLDTSAFFSVLAVTKVTDLEYAIAVLEDFGSEKVTHRVSAPTLLDETGSPITSPNSADFLGVKYTDRANQVADAARRANAIRDVANPPVPATKDGSVVGGTLVINSGGDYELETGAPLLKKLITRRLLTTRGAFFHLPDYGVGLGVKELLPAADLIKLRGEILRQVRREPEVEDVGVTLALGTSNDLTVTVVAKLRRTGEPVALSLGVVEGQGVIL